MTWSPTISPGAESPSSGYSNLSRCQHRAWEERPPRFGTGSGEPPRVFAEALFPDAIEPLLTPPNVESRIDGDRLQVTVRFPKASGEESGRIWWFHDRAPDGSPDYLKELIPSENSKPMERAPETGAWQATIPFESGVERIDFFSNHRKTLRYKDRAFPTYLSSPYTRVER